MTIIAGACRGGKVWLGGDAGASDHLVIFRSGDPKVWRSGGLLVGGCGDFRTLDAARRITCPAKPDEDWIRYGFSADLAKMFRELDGYLESEQRPDEGSLVLGGLGSLWLVILPRLAVVRVGASYYADGSGGSFALGAMHARPGANPRERVRAGLAAAAEHNPNCCEPFTLVSL